MGRMQLRREEKTAVTASSGVSFVFRQEPAGPFGELDRVRLNRKLKLEQGISPEGSIGTIVAIWKQVAAYDVEFSAPFHAVETVGVENLDAAPRRG